MRIEVAEPDGQSECIELFSDLQITYLHSHRLTPNLRGEKENSIKPEDLLNTEGGN